MAKDPTPLSVVKGNRTVFIAIGVGLLLLELAIFAIAAVRSGEHYKLQFLDAQGNMVYETDGQNLTDFNKYHFEKVHGPVRNYKRRLIKEQVPFPFRAWFVAAVGVPLGLVLCFVFVLKAYMALFYDETRKEARAQGEPGAAYESRLEKIIGGIQKFNIFIIAAVIFLVVISYWILPNLIIYLGEVGVDTVVRFKWVLLLVGVAAFGLLLWIIYLKFLLAKKGMESQVEIDKFRMQLEYKQNAQARLQLEDRAAGNVKTPRVGWDDNEVVDVEEDEST
ncbi:MAG: hypothetical protein JRI36_00445 [Deltaproteobacteria bacterium]|nr:hypothetical protein [Deltaproteobacteria bacterium]